MKLVLVGLLAFSFSAIGGERGNGGDAVVCRDSNGAIRTAELLDYYEARAKSEQIDLGAGELRQRVQTAINRIAKFSKPLAKTIGDEANVLRDASEYFLLTGKDSEKVRFTGDQLEDVPDSSHMTYPQGCKVEQLVIRLDPELQAEYDGAEYLVQKDIWSSLDKNSQAGIVLHESLYKNAVVNLAQENSRKSRRLNRVLSEKAFDSMNFIEFANTLGSAGYNQVDTGEFKITFINSDPTITPFPLPGGYFTAPGLGLLIFDANGKPAPFSVLRAVSEGRTVKFISERLVDSSVQINVRIGDRTCSPVESFLGKYPVLECSVWFSADEQYSKEYSVTYSTQNNSSKVLVNFTIGQYFGGEAPMLVKHFFRYDKTVSTITRNSPIVISNWK